MISPKELERLPFFKDLDPEERALLAGIARRESAAAGQRIFEEGQPSHTFYIVVSGLVSLRKKTQLESAEVAMAAGRPGELIGVSAMLGEAGIHPTSGLCLEPTELIEIDAAVLMAALESNPAVGFRILRRLTHIVAERLAAARSQILSQIRPGLITHG
ncbi:MAG: cyclic nucleotide-binding domain-containing protein [Acidimicrobiia bacterium]|nr:cyclic nucleotide-binding domain-containing protein [Acidimicrobiia bacterium]MDH3398079.1 cyclic nucleotide-binding domain-containing protein [Acidimicrobiia bacterium]MDH5615114.1 cyclic nucleotide-binding domain-containing protein [Acidimicrobiia bacterium]